MKDDALDFQGLTKFVETAYDGSIQSLSDVLEAAVAKCASESGATGGKASLTLKVTFKASGREVAVSANVTTSVPNPSALPSRLYLNKQGALVLDDPKQAPLPFTGEVVK